MGLLIVNITVSKGGTNIGKSETEGRVRLTVAKSGTNSGKEWD